MSLIVVSVPFDGPTGHIGRRAGEEAERAVEDAGRPVELEVRDAGPGPLGEHVAANARRAAGDEDVIGYIGDFHSAATEVSLPILEAAGIPHISFSNTLRRLAGRSFVSVMPNDERLTAGLVEWMCELGVERPFLLDDREEYGIDMRWLVHRDLASRGRAVLGAARLSGTTEPPAEIAGADGIFLGTHARPEAIETLRAIRRLAPEARIFATDGLLTKGVAAQAPDGLHLSAPPAPADLRSESEVYAAYAREAVRLLLDAHAIAGPDRPALVARLRSTRERESPLGPYGFDEHGASTLSAIRRFRTDRGELVRVA